jgi:hypothetical protein
MRQVRIGRDLRKWSVKLIRDLAEGDPHWPQNL